MAVVWWRDRRSELVKFGVVGGLAFVVDLGLFNLLHYGAHAPLADRIVTAKIVSAAIATVVAWVGNRMWTFRERRTGRPLDELVVFAFINVVALLIPVGTVAFTAYVLGLREAVPANIAAIIGIGIGTVTRYIGYHRYVFTDPAQLHARLFRALCSAPDRILLVTVSLAAACAVTVTLGAFRPWTVLPLAAALAAAGWLILPTRRPSASIAQGSGLLLTGVAAWIMVNLPFVAEYLIVRRDPGFLTLTGMWLVDHSSPDIFTGGTIEASAEYHLARPDQGEAWTVNGDVIQAQGAKLLPALIAVGGWAGGTTGVLTANLIIGAIGLIAVYVLAREVMSPVAALVPALGVSLTVSHIWLSRAAYTEPLTMLLLLAAIAWAWRGIKEGRAGPVIVAAVSSGLIVFARIDGAAYAVGLLAGVSIALLGSRQWSLRRRSRTLVVFALVQAAMVAAGYAALGRWSKAYLDRLSDEAGQLLHGYLLLTCAALVAALVCLLATSLSSPNPVDHPPGTDDTLGSDDPAGSDGPAPSRVLPWLAAGGVTAAFVVLATRPLWTTVHGSSRVPDYIEYLQETAGVPVDASRTYAESTVTWMSYYLTWPLLALGVAGFAIMAWKWASENRAWAVPLGAFLAPTFLYLFRPSIVPDQVWAIRRLYGSGVTGLVIAAAIAWVWLAKWFHRHLEARRAYVASIIVAAGIAFLPMIAWWAYAPGVTVTPIAPTSALYLREQAGARSQIETLCEYTDGRPVILVGTTSHFGTIRVACDVPVVLVQGGIDANSLQAVSSTWEAAPVVLTQKPEYIPWTTEPTVPTFEATARYSSGSLLSLPIQVGVLRYHWYIGDVLPDGSVEFVSEPRAS
ncbi:MAG: GtrA family protein [Demequinaceae bacterium]|nr:GtrA family protein [Demequinaceae bacterium]